MHNSACPKCGTSFDGDVKKCGSCGALPAPLISCSSMIASYATYLCASYSHISSPMPPPVYLPAPSKRNSLKQHGYTINVNRDLGVNKALHYHVFAH
ncbi:hypothetical protein F5Y13DRAFT_35683 [Hypoxylon sp. FL1857]|nr:hypothetical protein F5Y13DRAFT_35683 [Hypoxylon sp. FL1857]